MSYFEEQDVHTMRRTDKNNYNNDTVNEQQVKVGVFNLP